MRKWISYPHKEGVVSRQAHADLPRDAIFEREVGRSGFFGPTAHFHHKHPPTGWSEWQGPLRPRAFDLGELKQLATASPFAAPLLLSNPHCRYRIWQCHEAMPRLARNSDGDDLLFIHDGEGDLFCDYGHLFLSKGDYVILPRSTMWRLEPKQSMTLLMVEATNDAYQLPDKGILGPQAIFDPAMLDVPQMNALFKDQQTETPWTVEVKRLNQVSTVKFGFNPLDAVGWHGDLSVVRINWSAIRPIMSHRYHLPPSVHSTFVAQRFVVCTFVPRPFETDPCALKVPFYHNNDDFDEVIFYHQGDFFSRDNIKPMMVTFHPSGFTHGPHPKAFENAFAPKKAATDEVAVMVDTRDPLVVNESASAVEFKEYVNSWQSTPNE